VTQIKPQLTPYDLADVLNISSSAAYSLCRDPTFPAYKLGEGKNSNWRIDPDDLEKWVESKKVENIRQFQTPRTRHHTAKPRVLNGFALKWD
jgi:hypothetical protein